MFRQFAAEFKGDSRVSAVLFAAYQKRLRVVYENKWKVTMAEKDKLFDRQSWNTPTAVSFRKHFNNACKWAFYYTMTEYQDYTQPILLKDDFVNYMELAKTVFRPQWRFLMGLRNY